jgi:drug/metabolite transporter (DMT)-like permease
MPKASPTKAQHDHNSICGGELTTVPATLLPVKRIDVAGCLFAAGAMIAVGSSVAASSLFKNYPILGGQGLRYAIGAVVLVLFARGALPRLERAQLPRVFVLSSVGLAGFNVFLIAALRKADAGSVGVVIGCVPVALALVGPTLERRRPSMGVVTAAVVVTAGAAAVQWAGGRMTLVGFALAFAAMACEVAFTLLAVPLLGSLGPVGVSAYACAAAGVLLIAASLATEGVGAFPIPTQQELLSLLYLAVFVTALAFVLWYSGVARLSAERAGLFAGLVPVVALLTSAAVGSALLNPARVLGSVAVATGVVFGARFGGPD